MEKDPVYDLSKELLVKILDNTFMNIFVADNTGKIVFANKGSLDVLGVPREELIGMTSQDLLDKKIIDTSITLNALGKKEITVGEQRTITGYKLMVLSRPLFDDDNNVAYVMTNSSPDTSMHSFFSTLEKERLNTEKYKNVLTYFMEHNGNRNKIVVESQVMQLLFERMKPAIQSDSTILLYGESGVGKDVLANYIHTESLRSSEPFIPVNCAAIPQELMESEFFGYEVGAFTGASRNGRAGFFEMANHGTLFLDEIGELPLSMQSKLLRVLDDKTVSRIGSKKGVHVNTRIIAATNRNLAQMVTEKSFREDLYYRLNVIPFTVPPLRNRRDDIIPLAEAFLDNYNQKHHKSRCFSVEVLHAFLGYFWKGNIRELKNVVERLSIMAIADVISTEDLQYIGFDLSSLEQHNALQVRRMAQPLISSPVPSAEQLRHTRLEPQESTSILELYQRIEKEQVLKALIAAKGNKSKAAKALEISRGKLYKLLES